MSDKQIQDLGIHPTKVVIRVIHKSSKREVERITNLLPALMDKRISDLRTRFDSREYDLKVENHYVMDVTDAYPPTGTDGN